ncbi:MAG: prolipoprotein diacylglyceryl transferase [Deltaproteobacteria bacterium CG_4_10_14_3_um_filter_60_8]|nr:MAG: prolipoprotein diacylglyceryl transferase [Desulfobacterales bacterium CG2_30_60_27]PIP43173.1 MAG: prolipoprotein diacylglyceryl transferase [Deltaproteobacteria bacterium CG23_combo_of_CG06-09_8_20_14_all_60_8]PIY21173.1 MAG: prolipoprotein diacylglyceryl transferase [Deltaproteobacteria bacterium CG_4_10_14_3_um_filter_60_8]
MHITFNPVAFSLFGLQVQWYGLMYLVGFVGAWYLGRRRAGRPGSGWRPLMVDDLLFYGGLGVILGGRVGYILFYSFKDFLVEPLLLVKIWQGGMSFHGGFLGVLVALWLYTRKSGKGFWETVDFAAPLVPIGLGAGRIGNFINGELWGKPTDLPWGVIFPRAGALPRHPSQLYEALLEGVVLFIVLWIFSNHKRPTMAVSGLFALCYGLFRFVVEFVRLPDAHLGYLAFNWLTMGQVLSLPLIVAGLVLLLAARLRHPAAASGS